MSKRQLLKGLLYLIVAMVSNIAGAQTFVKPETGKYYKIKGDNDTYPWLTATNKTSNGGIIVSANEADAAIFLKTENGLQDIKTGKCIYYSGSGAIRMGDTETDVTIGEHDNAGLFTKADKYSIKVGSAYLYNNNTDQQTHESDQWLKDLERYWGFIEVQPFTFVTPEVGKYYKIKGDNATHHWLTATVENGGIDVSNNMANAAVFQYTANRGLKDVSTGKYIGLNGDQISIVDNETPITISNASNNKKYIIVNDDYGKYLHNNQTDYTREGGQNASAQNSWGFIEVEPEKTDLTYSLTDNAGNTHEGSYKGVRGDTKPTFTGIAGISFSNERWDGSCYKAEIIFPFPVSSRANTNPTMIAIGASWENSESRKWNVEGNVVKVQTAAPDIADLNYLRWALFPQLQDGTFSFKIKNVGTGTFVHANPSTEGDVTGTNNPITLSSESAATSFMLVKNGNYSRFTYTNNNGATLYLSINSEKDTNVSLGVYSSDHGGNDIAYPTSTAYSLTPGGTGYATLYTPFAVTIPANLEAYKGTIEDNYLTLEEVTGTIPANTGVILRGTANTPYTFNSAADTDALTDNILTGHTKAVNTSEVSGKPYTLQTDENGGVVFKKYSGYALQPYKAYFVIPSSDANAPAFRIRFKGKEEGSTSINTTDNNQQVTIIYDLHGRRVEHPGKGIYIVNGKKVMIR